MSSAKLVSSEQLMKQLLFVNEYGIYPELVKALQTTDFQVTVEHLMRNALKFIKKQNPAIVVAEFAHDSQFRDRVSNLESMLAQIEGKNTQTKTIVIYDERWQEYLDKLLTVCKVDRVLKMPVSAQVLLAVVAELE
jgi:uncharacterized protein YozE (UPF0346 family)